MYTLCYSGFGFMINLKSVERNGLEKNNSSVYVRQPLFILRLSSGTCTESSKETYCLSVDGIPIDGGGGGGDKKPALLLLFILDALDLYSFPGSLLGTLPV